MPNKRIVPTVLWRLYRDRAQTLAHTIISLIPPHFAVDCRCKGRRCLQCCGGDALEFLIRPDDGSDYRKLLNHCFVVVDHNAPPLSEFSPDSRWSQHQIVERTIEMILCEQPMSSNVISNGYDRCNRSSSIVELLTCSAWDLLLQRVGDNVMVYLLRYTSIFLPLPRKQHHQVAGPPISDLCLKKSKHTADSQNQCPSLVQCGPYKKRKRVDNVNSMLQRQLLSSSFSVDGPLSSVSCVGCNGRSHRRPFSKNPGNNCGQKSFSEAATLNIGADADKSKGDSNGELQQSSNQVTDKVRKCLRPFRWQRRWKHRQINFQETGDKAHCTTICTDDNLPGMVQCDFISRSSRFHEKRQLLSSSFSVDGPLSSVSCVGCNGRSHRRPFSKNPGNNCGQKSFSEAATLNIGPDADKSKGDSNGELQQNSNQVTAKVRKRLRPFSGQRRRKRRQINFRETGNKAHCTTICTDDNLPGMLQCDFASRSSQFHEKRQLLSSSFSVDGPLSSVSCVGCNGRSHRRPFSKNPGNNCGQKSFSEAATLNIGPDADKSKGDSNGELQQNSNQVTAEVRKRLRPFSGQRRQINFQETGDKAHCTTICTDDNLPGMLQCDFASRSSHFLEKIPGQCSCCLRLQAPHLVTQVAQINRRSIFYNLEHSSSVLPQKHVLNSLKPNFSGSKFLIGSIFGLSDVNVSAQPMPCFHSSGFCLIGSACLYHLLVKSLKIIIRRSQSCQHLRLLEKHCAVSSSDQKAMGNSSSVFEGNDMGKKVYENSLCSNTKHCKKTLEAGDPQFEAVKHFCLKSQVVSFIWAVCRNIVPSDLLGTPSNWRILTRNISKFVRLRRFEKFSVRQCIHELKTSRFPFLSNRHCSCYLNTQGLNYATGKSVNMHQEFSKLNDATHNLKYKLLVNWIYWFFSCLVVPLVQANFYVTESEHGKADVYYYRKSTWESLTNRAITCLKDKHYCQLDDAAVRNIISKRTFGFSKLRLRPKENGVRILANLKASSRIPAQKSSLKDRCHGMKKSAKLGRKTVKFDRFKSVNYVLRDTHAVLKGLLLKEPDVLGSSVFDYNDVYRKLCPFLSGLKNGATTIPGVFVVVSDVSKAFDSIDQDKLLSVMKDVILKGKYLLEKSYQVVCTKKSLWVRENLTLRDQDISTGLTRFTSSVHFRSLPSILVDKGWSWYLKKEELLFNLNEHVKRNVLQLDKKFYLQGIGIPQGSILSSLLCSLYYGHLERNVIYPFLEKTCEAVSDDVIHEASAAQSSREDTIISSPSYMLLRFIDDFLFISTSRKQAASFFSRLQRGFRDYNCYMNEGKFCLNFDIGHKSGLPSNRVCVGEDGISFLRWSGLLINCCTLEVQGDYTRYFNNHLRSTLTVCWHCKPAHHLKAKLCGFMRPKCHPIFFDSNINSAAVVRLNIYQAFLLCAMQFHCYVTDLSYICKLNARSYLKIIERSLRYMHVLIKKRMRSVYFSSNFRPVLQLGEGEVKWLGLNAYIEVLKRKQSQHKDLLSLLRSKLSAHRIAGSLSCQLKYAVDRSHSSLLWKIKY